jgi:pseudouridine-5'-phosphate glycosidase
MPVNRPGTVPLRVTDEVAEALRTGAPVVALESNVITHGLDYPENAATARKVEAAVRAGGAVPATIGVDAGRVLVGMTDADIDRFASGAGIPKVSSRDLAVVLASGGPGATTGSVLVATPRVAVAYARLRQDARDRGGSA